jgi:hypothetical protein
MFVSNCPDCCFTWCNECVPHVQPPATITFEIHPGVFECAAIPSGVSAAITSMLSMTLTLDLQGEWRPGYKAEQPSPIIYYLEFTPTGSTQTFRASVLIPCNDLVRVGWDNGQMAAAEWPVPGYTDYKLLVPGWGIRTANAGSGWANYQLPESLGESTPNLHQSEVCHPDRMYLTKEYWWGTYTFPEFGPSISVKRTSTGQTFSGNFSQDNFHASDCSYIHVTVPPSTLPWDNPFT